MMSAHAEKPTFTGQISTMLPAPVRNELIQAAGIDPDRQLGESDKRTQALEVAIERAKIVCPQSFR